MEKKLSSFTETEIKAALYELIEDLNKTNSTIKIFKQELDRRKAIKEKQIMEETTNVEAGGVHTSEEIVETVEESTETAE